MNIVNGFIVFVPNKNQLSISQEWVTWLSSICADGSVIYLGVLSPPSEYCGYFPIFGNQLSIVIFFIYLFHHRLYHRLYHYCGIR